MATTNRVTMIAALIGAVFTFDLAALPRDAAAARRRPNILFIILDDVGIDQMRVFGYDQDNQPRTPSIDAIALAGVRFRNAWAMPECSPSRVAFFTGRYPLRTGVMTAFINTDLANSQMSPYESTAPRVLARAGYKSALLGKYHLAAPTTTRPATARRTMPASTTSTATSRARRSRSTRPPVGSPPRELTRAAS